MIQILSTSPLDPHLLDQAAQQDIRIDTLSLISTHPIRNDTLSQQVRQLGTQSLTAVFTSMNAVEAVARHLGSLAHPHGQSTSLTGSPDASPARPSEVSPAPWRIFCIGAATRHLVETHFGAGTIAATAPSAGQLADVILGHLVEGIASGAPTEVFFFCGDQRREELPEKLTTAGIRVHEITVYRTTQTPELIKDTYDGIVFFSPSAVHSFFSVNTLPDSTSLFAIGKTTADTIRTYSNTPVITSATPEKETLIRQMIAHYQKNI